jgi:tyrosine-protein kinase Etk/Wzc
MPSEQKESDIQREEILPPEQMGKFFLDFISIIIKRKRFFTVFVGGITIVAGIIAIVSPKWYKASASVFPAENSDILGVLGGASSLVKSLSAGSRLSSLGGPTELDRYVAILKSDRALMAVINKFDLANEYNITSYVREKTIKELLSNVEFEESDEGALVISVYDKSPEKSAEMANYFVQELNEINSDMKAQNARANRVYIEQRYQQNLDEIQKAQNAMKDFQQKNGVVAIPEQIEASVKAGAEIEAQLASKEIELAVLQRTYGKDNPVAQAKQFEVDEIQKKFVAMNASSTSPKDINFLLPFKKTPELAEQYLTLYRDLQIQSKVLEFIAPLYEQAKVEEKRETPSVIVLDHALVPERKAKPKVSLYALLAFVSSSVIGLLIVFAAEGQERLKKMYPERYSKILTSLRYGWFKTRI